MALVSKPSVTFRDVEVIELPIVPGADHPLHSSSFLADSAAITVDWEAQSRKTVDLDAYEQAKKRKKTKGKGLTNLFLPRAVRKRMLRKQGFETSDTEDEVDTKPHRRFQKKKKKHNNNNKKQKKKSNRLRRPKIPGGNLLRQTLSDRFASSSTKTKTSTSLQNHHGSNSSGLVPPQRPLSPTQTPVSSARFYGPSSSASEGPPLMPRHCRSDDEDNGVLSPPTAKKQTISPFSSGKGKKYWGLRGKNRLNPTLASSGSARPPAAATTNRPGQESTVLGQEEHTASPTTSPSSGSRFLEQPSAKQEESTSGDDGLEEEEYKNSAAETSTEEVPEAFVFSPNTWMSPLNSSFHHNSSSSNNKSWGKRTKTALGTLSKTPRALGTLARSTRRRFTSSSSSSGANRSSSDEDYAPTVYARRNVKPDTEEDDQNVSPDSQDGGEGQDSDMETSERRVQSHMHVASLLPVAPLLFLSDDEMEECERVSQNYTSSDNDEYAATTKTNESLGNEYIEQLNDSSRSHQITSNKSPGPYKKVSYRQGQGSSSGDDSGLSSPSPGSSRRQQRRNSLTHVLGTLAKQPVKLAKSTPNALGTLAKQPVRFAKSTHKRLKRRRHKQKRDKNAGSAESDNGVLTSDDDVVFDAILPVSPGVFSEDEDETIALSQAQRAVGGFVSSDDDEKFFRDLTLSKNFRTPPPLHSGIAESSDDDAIAFPAKLQPFLPSAAAEGGGLPSDIEKSPQTPMRRRRRNSLTYALGTLAKQPVRLAKSTPNALGTLAKQPVRLAKSTHRRLKRHRRKKAQKRAAKNTSESEDGIFTSDDDVVLMEPLGAQIHRQQGLQSQHHIRGATNGKAKILAQTDTQGIPVMEYEVPPEDLPGCDLHSIQSTKMMQLQDVGCDSASSIEYCEDVVANESRDFESYMDDSTPALTDPHSRIGRHLVRVEPDLMESDTFYARDVRIEDSLDDVRSAFANQRFGSRSMSFSELNDSIFDLAPRSARSLGDAERKGAEHAGYNSSVVFSDDGESDDALEFSRFSVSRRDSTASMTSLPSVPTRRGSISDDDDSPNEIENSSEPEGTMALKTVRLGKHELGMDAAVNFESRVSHTIESRTATVSPFPTLPQRRNSIDSDTEEDDIAEEKEFITNKCVQASYQPQCQNRHDDEHSTKAARLVSRTELIGTPQRGLERSCSMRIPLRKLDEEEAIGTSRCNRKSLGAYESTNGSLSIFHLPAGCSERTQRKRASSHGLPSPQDDSGTSVPQKHAPAEKSSSTTSPPKLPRRQDSSDDSSHDSSNEYIESDSMIDCENVLLQPTLPTRSTSIDSLGNWSALQEMDDYDGSTEKFNFCAMSSVLHQSSATQSSWLSDGHVVQVEPTDKNPLPKLPSRAASWNGAAAKRRSMYVEMPKNIAQDSKAGTDPRPSLSKRVSWTGTVLTQSSSSLLLY